MTKSATAFAKPIYPEITEFDCLPDERYDYLNIAVGTHQEDGFLPLVRQNEYPALIHGNVLWYHVWLEDGMWKERVYAASPENNEFVNKVYSKLRLIVSLKKKGKWQLAKEFIKQNDLEDEWLACQFISNKNKMFLSCVDDIVANKIVTKEELDEILEDSLDV